MEKRGYKLQEFMAHSANVNCLSIGKKSCRLFVTGGDDHKVNLWTISKPISLMSLCGHTNPVESVAFDTSDVLVLAGASTGVIKLWDLEEAKMVRSLSGHRSNCSAVEFHPFGEFLASGSMDTNLKIWDIRKKGCIHTYEGHSGGISTIRFTPDGRWVVSGGYDNVVKVWDLTAGKLLNDFKYHEGPIQSIDFHPLEFLLATGSADGTVKFWDLETFELIGSTRPEATGVCKTAFYPDGRTIVCGLDDSLKVYSWEPVIRHDSVDMGWSTLGDLCITDGNIVGCSYYQNSVGIWVADASLIKPYGAGVVLKQTGCTDEKFDLPGLHSLETKISHRSSTLGLHCGSPDYETKEIKNIYVDSVSGNPVAPNKAGSFGSLEELLPLSAQENSYLPAEKQDQVPSVHAKFNEQRLDDKSFTVQSVLPRDTSIRKEAPDSEKESITFARTKPGMLLRPAHVRRSSNTKRDVEKPSLSVDSGALGKIKSQREFSNSPNPEPQIVSDDGDGKFSLLKGSNITNAVEKVINVLSPKMPPDVSERDEIVECQKEVDSVRIVNGVVVVAGRTRSLVERFEKQEKLDSNEGEGRAITQPTQQKFNSNDDQAITSIPIQEKLNSTESQQTSSTQGQELVNSYEGQQSTTTRERKIFSSIEDQATGATPRQENSSSNQGQGISNTQLREKFARNEDKTTRQKLETFSSNDGQETHSIRRQDKYSSDESQSTSPVQRQEKFSSNDGQAISSSTQICQKFTRNEDKTTISRQRHETFSSNEGQETHTIRRQEKFSSDESQSTSPLQRREKFRSSEGQGTRSMQRQEKFSGSDVQVTKTMLRQEKFSSDESQSTSPVQRQEKSSSNDGQAISSTQICEKKFTQNEDKSTITRHETFSSNEGQETHAIRRQEKFSSDESQSTSPLQRREKFRSNEGQGTSSMQRQEKFSNSEVQGTKTMLRKEKFSSNEGEATSNRQRRDKFESDGAQEINTPQILEKLSTVMTEKCIGNDDQAISTMQRRSIFKNNGTQSPSKPQMRDTVVIIKKSATRTTERLSGRATNITRRKERTQKNEDEPTIRMDVVSSEVDRTYFQQKDEPQVSGRDVTYAKATDTAEDLMQTHDMFLSTLKSRLTKLQVVRHFWERNDIKGAISAMRKLPDTSVQADVISVLMEKMEILNLDLFSCLLPVLMSLLDSKMERHTKVSLEMLLKLVAVFGSVIRATVSAPPAVGVDLQAEQRREWCNQCFAQLEKIRTILPLLGRRGGVIAKSALELNLVLQQS